VNFIDEGKIKEAIQIKSMNEASTVATIDGVEMNITSDYEYEYRFLAKLHGEIRLETCNTEHAKEIIAAEIKALLQQLVKEE